MEITLIQGIVLSLFAFIAGLDSWLETFFIFRPIISATVAGIVLGDLQLGVIAGGLTELAYAGLTPAGGTQPPNPAVSGIMTVVIAYTTGVNPSTAIGLSLPFAMLMQYILLAFYSLFSFFMPKLDTYAETADIKAFTRIQYLLIGFFISTFVDFDNVLPAAVIGSAFALIEYFRDRENKELNKKLENINIEGGDTDGI